VLTASACGDIDSGCTRLQVNQEFYPPRIGSAKVLIFFFLFFYGHFSTEKRKETKMRMSFSAEKQNAEKIKTMRFLAPKNKKKTKFGRPLVVLMHAAFD